MFSSEDRECVFRRPWREAFVRADFERAYEGLGSDDDLRTSTIRGRIRSMQLRFDDAKQHFKIARGFRPEPPEVEKHFLELRLAEIDDAVLRSACGIAAALDEVVSPVGEVQIGDHPLETPEGLGARYSLGTYSLATGDAVTALRHFHEVVTSVDMESVPVHQRVSFECAAGAAVGESGERGAADMLVFTSLIGVNLIDSPLFLGICFCRAHAVLSAWGYHEIASRWFERIDSLECPEGSKAAFRQRAECMASTAVNDGRLCLA